MDAVGVDGAIIVSTFNLYRYDPSYALEVYANYPDRFRVVKPIDPADPGGRRCSRGLGQDQGSGRRQAHAARGTNIRSTDPRPEPGLAAAGRHGVPVNFLLLGPAR